MTELDVPSVLQMALDIDGMENGVDLVNVRDPWNRIKDVAFSQLKASLTKKWQAGGRPSKEARHAAQSLFLRNNSLCASWTYAPTSSWDEELMGETREHLSRFWRARYLAPSICDHLEYIRANARVGPGAAVGAGGCDFYTKLFASKLTSPSRLVARMYHEEVCSDPRRLESDECRIKNSGHGVTIRGSRLAFAPKNANIARCICVEPSLGMYYQLGFGRLLERSLLYKMGINLSKQPFKNRELARLGSIHGDLSTIDLSSASDSMSLPMLRWALPRDWIYILSELRSPWVEVDGKEEELHMVSSMGNGFTFPLQTIFFACIVTASARLRGIPLSNPWGDTLGNWAVFGDDIIVPKSITADVLRGLSLFGFTANSNKTFVEGPFRESCGHDYYRGHNVRGVYIQNINSLQARASAINQLNLFSTRTGLLVRHLVRELKGTARFHFVPRWENDDAGVKVPLRHMVKVHSKRYQNSYLYRCWRAVPRFLHLYEDRIHSPPGHKRRTWNPAGLVLSFLRGTVNTMKIGLREETVKYRTETGVAPNWDHAVDDPSVLDGVDWQRWETVVYLNFF
jgi:hypothetical protein